MKATTCIFLFLLAFQLDSFSQEKAKFDSCKTRLKSTIKAFIKGTRDTITNGIVTATIDPYLLKKGFELQLEDTSFKIFRFVFTFSTDNLICEMISIGNKIEPENTAAFSYDKIIYAEYIMVENIRVVKNNQCYILDSFILLTPLHFEYFPNQK